MSLRQLLRPRSIQLEQSGLNMDTESWNVAEERRVRKLQQIRQLLSIALGPDVDLNQEAKNLFMQQNQRVKNDWFDCFSSMPSYSLISIGRRQRGQGSPLAWDDDILPSLPSVAQFATMKIRTPARCERSPTKQSGNRDKKSRIRVAHNRRLACSR